MADSSLEEAQEPKMVDASSPGEVLEVLKRRQDKLQQQVKKLNLIDLKSESKIHSLQGEHREIKQKIRELSGEEGVSGNAVEELKQNQEEISEEFDRRIEDLYDKVQEINTLDNEDKISEISQEISDLRETVDGREEKIKELKGILEQKNPDISTGEDIEEISQKVGKLEKRLEELRKEGASPPDIDLDSDIEEGELEGLFDAEIADEAVETELQELRHDMELMSDLVLELAEKVLKE